MTVRERDLAEGFAALGLKRDDCVLVHSSLSSLGYVEGGAAALIRALRETVGADGLVIVPTLTGKATDSPEHPPVFDVRETPCWTGRVPETVRKMPEAYRSLHPTHSVAALGSRKERLAEGHETGDSPCDRRSPYYKNAVWGGYVLLIGVDQQSNTTVHCCEELARVPYHLQKEATLVRIRDGRGGERTVVNRLHDWDKPETDFNRIEGLLTDCGAQTVTRIGNAEVRLIRADRMLNAVVDRLLQTPHYLIAAP